MTSLALLFAPLAPLTLFMFVSSITPGPNNLMLLASGLRFGFARTVPHLLGITSGMLVLLAVAGAGVGVLLQASPQAGNVLTLLCCAYLLWLALGLLRAADTPAAESAERARPMRAWEALLFQFVNPKAWTIAVAACAISARLPVPSALRIALLAAVTVAVNLPCVSVWALFGRSLRRYLHIARMRQAFNLAMAALVVATALWMAAPMWSGLPLEPADPAHDPVLLLGR